MFSHSVTLTATSLPRRADGDQDVVRRKASNVAFNIMHASVMGSPVMDMLRSDGTRRCSERRALLGYSSYDSDNDSDKDSAEHWMGVPGDSEYFHRHRHMG